MDGEIATIEDVAALMMKTIASKEDIEGLASKEDVKEVRENIQELCEEMNELLKRLMLG